MVEAEITKPEPEIVEHKGEMFKVNASDIKPEKVNKVKTMLSNMPTTEKVISQVQCQACSKAMSAKNLKYSHAA